MCRLNRCEFNYDDKLVVTITLKFVTVTVVINHK